MNRFLIGALMIGPVFIVTRADHNLNVGNWCNNRYECPFNANCSWHICECDKGYKSRMVESRKQCAID